MTYLAKRIDREFSPSEVARIANVPTALQRDWRRRKILPERDGSRWSVFKPEDVIVMTVTRSLSECGFPLSVAREIADLCRLPVLSYLSRFADNFEFSGDEIDEASKARLRLTSVGGAVHRYLKVPLPPSPESLLKVQRSNDLEAFEFRDGDEEISHFLVIDHMSIVSDIMAAVTGPLFHVEIEEIIEE